MSGERHDFLLGAYSLGVLDREEVWEIEEHLAFCERCRAELAELDDTRDLLAVVPPSAFAEQPLDADELFLRRTLSRVRAEAEDTALPSRQTPTNARTRTRTRTRTHGRGRGPRARVALAVAAAAVVGVGAGGLGVGLGVVSDQDGGRPPIARPSAPPATGTPPVTGTPPATALPPGTRTVTAAGSNGVGMRATVIPARGWIRLKVAMSGIAPGRGCRISVLDRFGVAHSAGTWVTSGEGGAPVDGAASVAAADVAAVQVVGEDGTLLATARF
ncbi:anti-sigma factor family protein [Actinomadura sp. 6N118]|uniref:anti-sigma factor family protein n=1 Tax=Actinomadura sp. 6N118 TaxID=3375151 RepID=UPI00378D13EA